MRADAAGFFDHADRKIGVELLEPDREGQARRAATHGDDVVRHHVTFDGLGGGLAHAVLLGLPAIVRALIGAGNPDPSMCDLNGVRRACVRPVRALGQWSRPSRKYRGPVCRVLGQMRSQRG